MQSINAILKRNAQNKADLDNSRNGTFCVLSNGSVLIRSIRSSKTIEDKSEVASFLEKVKDKSTGVIREVVKSYFEPVSA